MVHWADLLYKDTLHNDRNFSFDNLFNDEPYVKAADGALKSYKGSFLDKTRAGLFDLIGDAADGLKIHAGMDSFADYLIGRLLKDLDFYYDNRDILDRNNSHRPTQEVLRQELLECLIPLKGNAIMLIAHSMGTIISYDALRDLGRSHPDFELSHFVTIGSPLGLPHVKQKSSMNVATTTKCAHPQWLRPAGKILPTKRIRLLRISFLMVTTPKMPLVLR